MANRSNEITVLESFGVPVSSWKPIPPRRAGGFPSFDWTPISSGVSPLNKTPIPAGDTSDATSFNQTPIPKRDAGSSTSSHQSPSRPSFLPGSDDMPFPNRNHIHSGNAKIGGLAIDNTTGSLLFGLHIKKHGRYLCKQVRNTWPINVPVDINPVYLASVSEDKIVISDGETKAGIYSTNTGQCLHNLEPSDVPVWEWYPIGVCCHGNVVFISNRSRNRIECFSAVNGEHLGSPVIDIPHPPDTLAISSDGEKLMICSEHEVLSYCYHLSEKEVTERTAKIMDSQINGELQSKDDVRLTIPQGAIPRFNTVNVSLSTRTSRTYPPLLNDQFVLGPTMCCKPDGQNFAKPITLSIPDCFVHVTRKCIQVWCKSERTEWKKIYDGKVTRK